MSNYPWGVSDSHPYFRQEDAPEYDHNMAIAWIADKDLEDEFDDYVAANDFPEIKEIYAAQLHPEMVLLAAQNGWDITEVDTKLWHSFLWEVLDWKRFKVLVEAFTSSRIDEYEEYAA